MDVQQLLAQLVSCDSVFGNEESLAEWLEGYLTGKGFETHKQFIDEHRFNVLARRGDGNAKLLCYGHLDTVPVYNGWETDPFTLTEDGDKLYGLGACDMKGGIAAMLIAIDKLPKDMPICILFAVDEENDSKGSWTLAANKSDWLQAVTHIISGEPGASATKIGGSDVLTLGRRGRGRYTVKIHGVSAHGGHVERGVNAISLAATLIKKVEAMKLAHHPKLKEASHFVAKVEGSAKGLSIPEFCELEIDRHLVLPETVDSALREYKAVCREVIDELDINKEIKKLISIQVEVKKRENNYMEPYVTEEDDPVVLTAKNIISDINGKIVINYGRSVGDENIFANELDIKPIILGPEGGNIHSCNEWVSLLSLNKCVKFYERFFSEIAAKK